MILQSCNLFKYLNNVKLSLLQPFTLCKFKKIKSLFLHYVNLKKIKIKLSLYKPTN
jgi:hypothetical protein